MKYVVVVGADGDNICSSEEQMLSLFCRKLDVFGGADAVALLWSEIVVGQMLSFF